MLPFISFSLTFLACRIHTTVAVSLLLYDIFCVHVYFAADLFGREIGGLLYNTTTNYIIKAWF
jgi:hypothetical protein